MFKGEYQHSLDDKNRLIMPARFREGLGERFVITKGLDTCLAAYSESVWEQVVAKLQDLPYNKADARTYSRMLLAGASDCEFDKQGRIVIPSNLKQHGKLEKDCVIIGVGNRIEIWSKAEWERYSSAASDAFEEVAEKIEVGI